MACGSGCCKPAAAAPAPPTEPLAPAPVPAPSPIEQQPKAESTKVDDDGCQDSCCGAAAEATKSEGSGSACCASSVPAKDGGDDGCKTTTDDNPTSKESLDSEAGCKDTCCASSKPVATDANDPPCCKGKASPCCDASCLDRLARRSCDRDPQCKARNRNGEPCIEHRRTIRERFADRLERIECICRALISLGQESCCLPVEPSPSVVVRTSRRGSKGSKKSRASLDSCCDTPATATMATSLGKTCGKSTVKKRRSKDSCCISSGRASPSPGKDVCAKGCCGQPKAAKPLSIADSCSGEACCSGEKEPEISTKAVATDPELGLDGSEHVVLSISGMTCTGCETKLSRTLAGVPGISNLKTSLILSRAEFDLSVAVNSVTNVTKHLERTTEFTCERIINQGSTIDVIPKGSCEEFLKQDYPDGVTEMTLVGKDTVRIAFDAKIIGARDLRSHDLGAPFELAPPRTDPTLEAGSKHVRNLLYMTIFSAILTIPVLVLAWAPLPENEIAYGSASLALATIIQVIVAGPFYPKSLKSLIFSRVIEMDLLIVLSTTAAYIFSVVAFGYLVSGNPLSTGEFFETSTLLVTLIMVGRYVGAMARQKAVESISVRSLQITEATLVGSDDQDRVIDTRLLQYGDRFKVMPHSRVPTDGTVESGTSEVDESMITGESRPVEKEKKSNVVAGSINGSGTLTVRLTRLPGENTISTIASMVDEAKLSKPKIQDMADKVASYFVPVVLFLTLVTFVAWVGSGINARNLSSSEAVVNAITFAISVLIVSCPCAIGLAVPMVIVVATGVAADRGVIFKTAESIEIAHKTSHVVFDKTGTLTEGKLAVVTKTWAASVNGQDDTATAAGLLLGLVGGNKHPVSAAVAAHLKSRSTTATEVKDMQSIPGKGVEGTGPSGRLLRAGNSRWLNVSSEPSVVAVLEKGYTAFCFTIDGTLAAVFGLEDSLRHDALETVSKLQARGIKVSLLSGDDDGAVRDVAARLSIEESHVRSRCTPADKRDYIQALLELTTTTTTTTSTSTSTSTALPMTKLFRKSSFPSKSPPVIMFCGDGTNDAVALAQATVGVHMNEGTDVAQAAADVVLVRPRLGCVLTAIDASRAAVRRVYFNFAWSFVYNVFAVLLAAGAFGAAARIPPQFAGLGEIVSVLPVIAAAVALRWAKI